MGAVIYPQKNIVILGAGFGGLTAAKKLGNAFRNDPSLRQAYNIILVDKQDTQTYTPGLYEVASLLRSDAPPLMLKHTAAIMLEDALKGLPVRFRCDEVRDIEIPAHAKPSAPFTVHLRDTDALHADYLILALGSVTNDFGIPGVREHAFSLKTFQDALHIRSNLTPLLKDRSDITVIIAGGGATGVELAGELVGLSRRIARTTHLPKQHRFVLVEAGPRLVPGAPDAVAKLAKRRLESIGVSVQLQKRITEVRKNETSVVSANGTVETIPFDIFVWSGGIQPNPVLKGIVIPKDQRGRCMVDLDLTVHGWENLFALGDLTCFANPKDGKPLPATAYIAIDEGTIAAKNVLARIYGKGFGHYHPPTRPPFVVPIKGKWAIAYVSGITFSGIPAFLLRLLIDLRYFLKALPFRKALKFFGFSTMVYFRND